MDKRISTRTLTIGAALTAIVLILQLMGAFIRLGPFSMSFVLVPIVVGAATCGTAVGTWLGLVFGVAVLISGDAAPFLAVDVFGAVVTVLVKGALCGLVAGLIYNALKKINKTFAAVCAAIACPITNTGVFLAGCSVFFMDTLKTWGQGGGFGDNVLLYMIVGLVGINFVIELGINIVLSPAISTLLNVFVKEKK